MKHAIILITIIAVVFFSCKGKKFTVEEMSQMYEVNLSEDCDLLLFDDMLLKTLSKDYIIVNFSKYENICYEMSAIERVEYAVRFYIKRGYTPVGGYCEGAQAVIRKGK